MKPIRRFAGWSAAGAACLLVAACSTAGTPVAQQTSGSVAAAAAPAPPASPAPQSDEDQVRAALKTFQDAYNTENWDAYLEMVCPVQRAKHVGPVMDAIKKGRADTGITTVTVVSVKIDGDQAAVVIDGKNETTGAARATITLERGDDGWKVCMRY